MSIGDWTARLKTKVEHVFGQRRPPPRVELAAVAEQVVKELAPSARQRSVRVRLRAYAAPVVLGNRAAVHHALSTAVASAVRYTPPSSTVLLQIDREGSRAIIDVVDDGPAAAAADTPALAEVRSIVSGLGGEVGTVEGGGGHVHVELPCSKSEPVRMPR